MWAYVALDPVMVEAPPDTTTTPPPPTWTAWVDLAAGRCTVPKGTNLFLEKYLSI